MSTKTETELIDGAGGARSEPGGRAQRPAGAARRPQGPPRVGLPDEVRDRLADAVIDELLAGACTEEEIVGPGGVLAQLTKRLVERALSAELTEHLGYEPHQEPPGGTGNTRNGSTAKTLATEHGPVRIGTPRDRRGTFEPQIVRKGQRRACYLALGVTVEGERDVLGMWFQETEGAKFWMQVLSELKQRGVNDILLCCVDGLKGFPEAIEAIYPATVVQTCVVHLIRHSLKYVPRREREQVARDLKPIYTAVDADAAQAALEAFDDKWGARFPVITQAWLNAWEYVTPFLAFPPELRRVVYTTNAIEALNRQLRKAIKAKGHFPNEEAARKLIYLAIVNAVPAWTRTRNWTTALLAFKIHFGDRLPE